MLRRRLRGLLTSMALGSIPWAGFGLLVGTANALHLLPGSVTLSGPAVLGSFTVALTLTGALVGAVNGAVFGGLLMVAEHRHRIDELRASRVGLWSALATGATVFLLSGVAVVAGVCSVLGFGVGAAALRLVQAKSDPAPAELDVAAR